MKFPKYIEELIQKKYLTRYLMEEAYREQKRGLEYLRSDEYKKHCEALKKYHGIDKSIGRIKYLIDQEDKKDAVALYTEVKHHKHRDVSDLTNSKRDKQFLSYCETYGIVEPVFIGEHMFYLEQTRECPPYTAVLHCQTLETINGEVHTKEHCAAYIFREQWRRKFSYAQ